MSLMLLSPPASNRLVMKKNDMSSGGNFYCPWALIFYLYLHIVWEVPRVYINDSGIESESDVRQGNLMVAD